MLTSFKKWRKSDGASDGACKDMVAFKSGASVVSLVLMMDLVHWRIFENNVVLFSIWRGHCCNMHTSGPMVSELLRGFEDEKFYFVAFRRGHWPRQGT